MMRRRLNISLGTCSVFAALLTCSACDHAPVREPEVRIVETKVPVAVPCTPHLTEPAHPDTKAAIKAAPDAGARELILAAGRQIWIAWATELKAALTGCGAKIDP